MRIFGGTRGAFLVSAMTERSKVHVRGKRGEPSSEASELPAERIQELVEDTSVDAKRLLKVLADLKKGRRVERVRSSTR